MLEKYKIGAIIKYKPLPELYEITDECSFTYEVRHLKTGKYAHIGIMFLKNNFTLATETERLLYDAEVS